MLIAMVLFLFLLAMLFECATVLKHAGAKVKIIHFSIMLVSFCVLMLHSLDVPILSPTDVITDVVEAIFHLKD